MAQKTIEELFHATRDTDFDPAFWNGFLGEVGTRFRSLEKIKIDWETVSRQGIEVALERINEVLGPAAERVQNIAALGFLSVESKSSRTLALGVVSFTPEAGDQLDLFVPTPFVAVTRATDPFDFAIGRVVYFNRADRIIDIEIVYFEGDPGPHNDWTIAAVAGQALAQTSLLNQTVDAKDEAVSAMMASAGYQADVTTKAGTVVGLWNAFRMAVAPSGPTTPVTANFGQFWYDGEIVRVYDGSAWAPAVTASIGGIRTESGTFGASPSGNITVGGGFSFAMVWLNGTLLKEGPDYTASTPLITITGATEGDEYFVWAYQANDPTDYYTKEEANGAFAPKTSTATAIADNATAIATKVTGPASLTGPTILGRLTGSGDAQALSQSQSRQLIGGWEFIGTYSLAGLSVLDITNLGAYRTLRINGAGVFNANNDMNIRFSADNGATFGADSDEFLFTFIGTRAPISGGAVVGETSDGLNSGNFFLYHGGNTGYPTVAECVIYEFNQARNAGTLVSSRLSTATDRYVRMIGAAHKRATVQNALRFYLNGTTAQSGSISIEGIRG